MAKNILTKFIEKNPKYGKVVKSIAELKNMAGEAESPYAFHKPFFILLAGGAVRSSKEIAYDKKRNLFNILNCIDGTQQTLTPRQLYTQSNIGEAIKKSCLIAE